MKNLLILFLLLPTILSADEQKWDYYTEEWIEEAQPEPEPLIKSGPKPVAYVLSYLAQNNPLGVVVSQTGIGGFVTIRVEFVKYVWLEPDGIYETNSVLCSEDDELGVTCK